MNALYLNLFTQILPPPPPLSPFVTNISFKEFINDSWTRNHCCNTECTNNLYQDIANFFGNHNTNAVFEYENFQILTNIPKLNTRTIHPVYIYHTGSENSHFMNTEFCTFVVNYTHSFWNPICSFTNYTQITEEFYNDGLFQNICTLYSECDCNNLIVHGSNDGSFIAALAYNFNKNIKGALLYDSTPYIGFTNVFNFSNVQLPLEKIRHAFKNISPSHVSLSNQIKSIGYTCEQLNTSCSCLNDDGSGYYTYSCINNTNDLDWIRSLT